MVVNLGDLGDVFSESEVVSLESVKAKKLIKVNKRDGALPLKASSRVRLCLCCT